MKNKKEIAAIPLVIHIYLSETGEYQTELEMLTEGNIDLTNEEFQQLLEKSKVLDQPKKMSGRIGQCLFILGKIKELAGDDPDELAVKLKTNELNTRVLLQQALHSASIEFNSTYATCQDKMCRQLEMKVVDWDPLIEQWIVKGKGSPIKELLLKHVPNTAMRESDIKHINDFFRKDYEKWNIV